MMTNRRSGRSRFFLIGTWILLSSMGRQPVCAARPTHRVQVVLRTTAGEDHAYSFAVDSYEAYRVENVPGSEVRWIREAKCRLAREEFLYLAHHPGEDLSLRVTGVSVEGVTCSRIPAGTRSDPG